MNLFETTQSTSQHTVISWNEERNRWQVEFDFDGKTRKYYFENEFDAIKTRNRIYKKMGIPNQPVTYIHISDSSLVKLLSLL